MDPRLALTRGQDLDAESQSIGRGHFRLFDIKKLSRLTIYDKLHAQLARAVPRRSGCGGIPWRMSRKGIPPNLCVQRKMFGLAPRHEAP